MKQANEEVVDLVRQETRKTKQAKNIIILLVYYIFKIYTNKHEINNEIYTNHRSCSVHGCSCKHPKVDKLSDIKNVLASGLDTNVKVAAASSMIKVATLSDADYSRIVDYWKNELGYGDQEWIDALFTKKYDKK
jgi:hypothetical protein